MSKRMDAIFDSEDFQADLSKIAREYFFMRLEEMLQDMFSVEIMQQMGRNLMFGGGTYILDEETNEKSEYIVATLSDEEYRFIRVLARKVLHRGATPYLLSEEAELLFSDDEKTIAMQEIVIAAMVFETPLPDGLSIMYQEKMARKIVSTYDKDVLRNAYILSQQDICNIGIVDLSYAEWTVAEYVQYHINLFKEKELNK